MTAERPIITRTYQGRHATTEYSEDAAVMARNGYSLVSQVRAPERRTAASSIFILLGVVCLVAGLLFFPLWGVAVVCLVIGLVSGKGGGELTVIWRAP